MTASEDGRLILARVGQLAGNDLLHDASHFCLTLGTADRWVSALGVRRVSRVLLPTLPECWLLVLALPARALLTLGDSPHLRELRERRHRKA